MSDQVLAKSATPAERRTASIAGWLMLLTFLTSIPASLILYEPILNETDFILGSGDVGRIQLGALLEIFQVIAQIGMAIAMYSILRRYSEILSLGFVASRIMESAVIAVGAISLLSILTLREDLAGSADPATLEIAGQTLVAVHDWTFLFGPGFCVGVNGLLLGWMMWRTGLMPQGLALFGVVGGPLIFASAIFVLFDVYEQDGVHALFSVPEAIFELSFAIYLIVKGFRPSPILSGPADAGQPTG